MIDMTTSMAASPMLHVVSSDPGLAWTRDADPAIEAPPDDDLNPLPEARWTQAAHRTGVCVAVSTRVMLIPDGGYRVSYSQMLPRPMFPAGANDDDPCTTRVLSAFSPDGAAWIPEPGVRLSAEAGGVGEFRVVSSEVVPSRDGRFRMDFECCRGPQSIQNTILSAISENGFAWQLEPGVRLAEAGRNLSSPRLIYFPGGLCRLYSVDRDRGIRSAVSNDGLDFHREPGLRIAQGDRRARARSWLRRFEMPAADKYSFKVRTSVLSDSVAEFEKLVTHFRFRLVLFRFHNLQKACH